MKISLSKFTMLVTMFVYSTYGTYAQSTDANNGISPRNLSMEEAIRLSLLNSKQLKLSHAKVDEAIANTREMWDNHLPDAKISGSYLRLNSPNVDLKVKLGGGSGGSSSSSIKVDQAAYTMANVSLPLFSGFRIKYGVESAQFLEKAARLDADNDKEEVVQNTINAYGNLYKAFSTIDLIKENLKQQQQRVADFSDLEKNGIIARNDLLKVQLQESNIELSLLDAENNYNIACINMNLMLGLAENSQLLPDSAAFQNQLEEGTMVQWEETAMRSRKDYSALTFREQAAGSSIKAAKGEYYPGLALTGGYIAADVPNLLTITNAFNVGLGLQYNLGTLWKTGAKIDAAKARLHQVQATESMLTDAIHLQISQAYQNYVLSKRKIEVYAKAIDQANENFRITKNKYTNSLVTTTDLLDADVAQLQARLNYAFSKADATVAYKKLLQTAGVLANSSTPNN